MREDLKVQIDLEAEDTLAVRLNSLSIQGSLPRLSIREALEHQTRAILDEVTFLDGALALIEVDAVSNAVLIRSRKPVEGRFVEIILRDGNFIRMDARGRAVHLSRENYEKLLDLFASLLGG